MKERFVTVSGKRYAWCHAVGVDGAVPDGGGVGGFGRAACPRPMLSFTGGLKVFGKRHAGHHYLSGSYSS